MPFYTPDDDTAADYARARKIREAWQHRTLTRSVGQALTRLRRPVGAGQPNHMEDVAKAQTLLDSAGFGRISETGGPTGWGEYSLTESLERFQAANDLKTDGFAKPDGETVQALAPFAKTIAAREGADKEDAPKAPPPSQPPVNPPVDPPKDEKPAEGVCRDEWWAARRAAERLGEISEAVLFSGDRIAKLDADIEEWSGKPRQPILPNLAKKPGKKKRQREQDAMDALDTARSAKDYNDWQATMNKLEAELSAEKARLIELKKEEREAAQDSRNTIEIFQRRLRRSARS